MDGNAIIVVFDISKAIFTPWIPALFLVVLVFFGVTAPFWIDRPPDAIAARFVSACLGILCLMILWSLWSEYRRLTEAYRTGHYLVAEGPVTDFRRDYGDGKSPETFVVEGVRFEMMGSSLSSEFHSTIGFGGPDLRRRCVRALYAPTPDGAKNPIIWLGLIPGCVGPRDPPGRT